MKFPLRSTIQIGSYVAKQKRAGARFPLVLMLEPTLACNIACIGCGKIREYESNKARLSVDECVDAGVQCPAPVVSICGGEPLVYKGIEDVVAGMLEMQKNIELCTNALKLEEFLSVFKPNLRLTFVVHLDGMREIHDYICDYPGLWDLAVDAIKAAAKQNGYRWLASPVYQEFLAGERKLACAPWGSITRNPYGWKGPCYLLTDGIFPTYDALLEGIEWEEYGPGNDPRCEHCGIHSGFEPSAALVAADSLKEGVRSMAWTLKG